MQESLSQLSLSEVGKSLVASTPNMSKEPSGPDFTEEVFNSKIFSELLSQAILTVKPEVEKQIEDHMVNLTTAFSLKINQAKSEIEHKTNLNEINIQSNIQNVQEFIQMKEIIGQGHENLYSFYKKILEDNVIEMLTISKSFTNDLVEQQDRLYLSKFDTISKELNAFKSQLDVIKDLKSELQKMNTKIDEKASYQNLRNFENQLDDFVKIHQLQELKKLVENKADANDFVISSQQMNLIQSQINNLKEHILTTKQLSEDVNDTVTVKFKDFE